jgi:hypothetical protein
VPCEYEHSSSRNRYLSKGPKKQNCNFLENGSNDSDQISTLHGDHPLNETA